jgi:glycosyltransferase involved in cell wall biosynthesis
VQRLLVISSVVHHRYENQLWGYGPYVRELELWADIFPELIIAAPCRSGKPFDDSLPIRRSNVTIRPIVESGGNRLVDKFVNLFRLPRMLWQLHTAMRSCDAIHVRCPGNLGLLGVMLAPLYSSRLVTKYAGQWTGFPGESSTYRLQRQILSSRWWKGPVTVYGSWPNQPPHIVPFFSTALTEEQMAQAKQAASAKSIAAPLKILFVGRISVQKRVDTLMQALGRLHQEQIPFSCTVVGEGEELAHIKTLATSLGLQDQVNFTGGIGFDEVLQHYSQAHVLVLASESEGFPKAILEGMAFGMVCIGSDRGFVPIMLGEERGLTVTPGDVSALAQQLRSIATQPQQYQAMAQRAAQWADRYSLGHMRDSIRNMLSQHWKVEIPCLYDQATEPVSERAS